MKVENVYWPIDNGFFTFPNHLEVIKSSRGIKIKDTLKGIDNGLQIFLRGSLLENMRPFERSDIDLIVIYENHSQLYLLRKKLQTDEFYDIKLVRRVSFSENYTAHALLNCRAVQICGQEYCRNIIKADKQFAWEHWIQYCPAGLPNTIDASSPFALIHFKSIARCFGVLSYLKVREFTRDITECINVAADEHPESARILTMLREALEQQVPGIVGISDIKRFLIDRYDKYMNYW